MIARKSNEKRAGRFFDKEAYRERNVVERTINRLKQFRRVATRYEKRAANYQAMLTIAADPRVPTRARHRGGDRPQEQREASRALLR